MNARHFFAALVVLALGSLAEAAPRAAQREAYDFVFMGDKGPVLIRFHVLLDDKPLEEAWEKFMGQLFAYLDLNGDGVLSQSEAERAPPPPMLFNNGPGFVARQVPNRVDTIDKDRDGKITRRELADWYRQNGAPPFQFRSNGPQRGRVVVTRFIGQPAPLAGNALNEKLFKLLDTDKDGKLSRAELAGAPARLAAMDLDDDEMVSAQEMSGNLPSSIETQAVFAIAQEMQTASGDPFVMVQPGQSGKQLARALLAHYAPKGKRSAVRNLTRKDLGMEEAAFARLDMDEDGTLDSEELAHFAQRDPDWQFRIRLGTRGRGEAGVELMPMAGRPSSLAPSVQPSASGGLVLKFGSARIELGNGAASASVQFAVQVREQYRAQFRVADADKNGYLDANEANRNAIFRNAFKLMDRDGDGKLFEKEVLAYLDKMKDLQEAAVRSCASLAVKDQGRGLFDLIDGNGDGRLSVRELRRMGKLLDSLDLDGDDGLTANEIPHNYRVDVRRGPSDGNALPAQALIVRQRSGSEPEPPAPTAGPRWFRKMDRNRDGDVSRREFLGTDETFRRIDTDGDGLISVEEATDADKVLRKEKERKP